VLDVGDNEGIIDGMGVYVADGFGVALGKDTELLQALIKK